MEILRPDSLDEALALIDAGAVPVAGGTAHQLGWSQGQPRPDRMVSIAPLLPDAITEAQGQIVIGAGTTLETIRRANLPLLSEAARDVAAPNIRRLATLGGTIGFGAGCLLPALLVMDAEVETTSGARPLADWLAHPCGVILSVALRPAARHGWRKTGLRAAFTPAIITAAAGIDEAGGVLSRLRLAVGGGVVPPVRLHRCETWLTGRAPQEVDRAELIARLEDEIAAPDCAFRTGAYRRRVAARVLARAVLGPAKTQRAAQGTRPAPQAPPPLTEVSRAAGGARWHVHPDMPAKVRGAMPYLTDARGPQMLIGRILRAAHPHAEILSIDTTRAEALPGVRAVVTHRDIEGLNAFGIVFQDQPALCSDKVRYLGDAVAAVAADSTEIAEGALGLIDVAYRPLPVVDDAEAALRDGAAKVHETGNLVTEVGLSRGDLAEGWAAAVHVVEDTYVTPRQMHGFMETEGGWAAPAGDGLEVHVGGQHGARDRMQLARILGTDEAALRVVTSPTGGAFGGKDELTVQPALALLARKAGAPVRLQLSRAESVVAGTKRNPMRIRMKTGCDAEGRLVAQEVDVISDCGAYASLSPGVLETAMEHCAGPYVVANITTRGRLAYTNNGTGGAFRGFGANQMTYAVECQMDRLAAQCGLDPVEMRRRNLRTPGSPGYLGQVVAPSERLEEMLAAAAASKLWAEFEVGPDEVAGAGMALNHQGNGLGTIPEDRAEVSLALEGGRVVAACGLDEMGQGLIASLHAAIAHRLGCAREDVAARIGDTGAAPDSGSTTASRGGYVVWRGVEETAPALEGAILEAAGARLGLAPEALRILPGGVGARGANDPAPLIGFAALGDIAPVTAAFEFPKTDYTLGNARFIFAFGATLARVAVNRLTGAVRIVEMEFHSAAGPVIDMASYLGQMEGGLVQGLGFTLSEDVVMTGGCTLTGNLDTYVMPTIRDVPRAMRVTAHEGLDPGDPHGPRGAGELGIGAVTPAIANAVRDAVGQTPAQTPFRPEDILSMVEAR